MSKAVGLVWREPSLSDRQGGRWSAPSYGPGKQGFVRSRTRQALKTGRKYIRLLASVNGIFLNLFKSDPLASSLGQAAMGSVCSAEYRKFIAVDLDLHVHPRYADGAEGISVLL